MRQNFARVESSSGVFQIRPFKEFTASRGRDRMLSLSRLSAPPVDDSILPASSDNDSNSNSSRPTNVYDFIRSRTGYPGDPTVQRWNASIRLANFASVDSSPLCVSLVLPAFLLIINVYYTRRWHPLERY